MGLFLSCVIVCCLWTLGGYQTGCCQQVLGVIAQYAHEGTCSDVQAYSAQVHVCTSYIGDLRAQSVMQLGTFLHCCPMGGGM